MKRLIIYYSLSGSTKEAAYTIAKAIGADLVQVDLKKPLPDARWKQMLIGGRQSTFGEKPEIVGLPKHISDYDEIIIGTPIWAGKAASPINTVLADKRIAKKVTAAFTLSGSGNNTRCEAALGRKLPNLKIVISLVDPKNKLSEKNAKKIQAFAETILADIK